MHGKSSRIDAKTVPKSSFMHGLMDVEKIDLLVVTETHSPDGYSFAVPNSAVLVQSGSRSSGAGIALVARDSFSWSCSPLVVLIPGHAPVALVSHSKRTESFWVLCVYGDISVS